MISGLLCPLGGALYATAILLYDTRFGFLLRVMPWLISAVCCVVLDILVSLRGAAESLLPTHSTLALALELVVHFYESFSRAKLQFLEVGF